jgi:hypothetical protein
MGNALMAKKAEEQFPSLFLRVILAASSLLSTAEQVKNCDFHYKGMDFLRSYNI